MCSGCYEEAGSPRIDTPQIRRVVKLCEQLYAFAPVGGNCHIVTDDWNIEDSHIEYCQRQVAEGGWLDWRTGKHYNNNPAQLAIEKELLDLMRPMSEAERASALGMMWGYFSP